MSNNWAPSDKSFSIKVPVGMEQQEINYNDDDPTGRTRNIRQYGANWSGCGFGITDIELTPQGKKLSSKDKFEAFKYFVAGYTEQQVTRRSVKINGLSAQEIVHIEARGKGLTIDAGDHVYLLLLVPISDSDKGKCINSPEAKRFFTSFKLFKPKK